MYFSMVVISQITPASFHFELVVCEASPTPNRKLDMDVLVMHDWKNQPDHLSPIANSQIVPSQSLKTILPADF